MSRRRRSLLHVFQAPIIIGAISFAGLVLALLVDGRAELLAVLAVASPVAVVAWALRSRY